MLARRLFHRCIVALAITPLLGPNALPAAEPVARSEVEVVDVRLDRQGRLLGLIVDGQGKPQSDVSVSLTPVGTSEPHRELHCDENGQFAFTAVKAGTYRLQTTEGVCVCRLWTHPAAPPKAPSRLLIVNDSRIERGQRPIREMFSSDPILMATVVAAAIAIPVAVHKARDDGPDGS